MRKLLITFGLAVMLAAVPSPAVAAEVLEVETDVAGLIGPDIVCESCCQYCWSEPDICPEDHVYVGTSGPSGPEDATIITFGTNGCMDFEGRTCEGLILCGTEEWDEADAEAAEALESALSLGDDAAAMAIMTRRPDIATLVPDRGIVVVKASPCVGGVGAVMPASEALISFMD